MDEDPRAGIARLAAQAFHEDDAAGLRSLLGQYPELAKQLNEPKFAFDSPAIVHVRSAAMLDVLLDSGADINARSQWWAGGFGLLDSAGPELAAYAIQRGAQITAHAAARLALLDKLTDLLASDPALVSARGGDGQTPLHFASTVEVARFLLDAGADIDARDIDHESTPAQYMVRSRQEVARYLVSRGCKTDLLMAAALGDLELVSRHLDADPESIRTRVGPEDFPMIGTRAGGTIYQWELGWYVSACQVAKAFGHQRIFELLMARSPAGEKLLNACWLHDEETVAALLAAHPRLAESLHPAGRKQLAHAARNNDTPAARLMLTAGLPVWESGQHHATPLHWASWHGNAELVRLILGHNPPLEEAANDFEASPLQWAIHGSENGWRRHQGDYGSVVQALLQAGAKAPQQPGGTAAVRAALSGTA